MIGTAWSLDAARPSSGRTGPAAGTDARLSPTQFLLPIFAFTALLAVPAVLLISPVLETHPRFNLAGALFGIATIYAAARLTGLMWGAQPRWMTIGFWLFTYAWIAVAGLTQTLADENPLGVTLTSTEQLMQASLVLVGMVCFDVAQRVRLVEPHPGGGTRERRLHPTRVLLLGWLSVGLSPVFIYGLGGPAALFSNREAIYDQLVTSGLYSGTSMAAGGILDAFANCAPFVSLLCVGKLLASDRAVRARLSAKTLLLLLISLNVFVNNPVSNSRYWAFTVILALLYMQRWIARPIMLSLFVTGFAVSALTVFPHLDATRNASQTIQRYHLQGNTLPTPLDYVLEKTDYGASTDVALSMRVGADGLRWGRQLLGAAGFWVPRSLWQGKPDNTATLIADKIGFVNQNLDTPLWGEGYVDFGWLGTAVFLGAAGLTARRLDDAFLRARTRVGPSVSLAVVLVPAVAGYEFILLRGSLLQAMSRITVMVALFLIVSRVSDVESEEPAELAATGVAG